MQYRHELKHQISMADMIMIRQRMRAIGKVDAHAVDGKYLIRSLYFDSPEDKALLQKKAGVDRRQKFRIRYYNGDKSVIHLEKKSKAGGLGTKVSASLTEDEAKRIVSGDTEWMRSSDHPLIQEFLSRLTIDRLKPKTIVDYTREPFIYGPGNVRVTLDYDIRTGLCNTDFLDTECVTIPAAPGICILEVKWDNFLPDIIRDAVQLPYSMTRSFSKYEVCRIPMLGGRGE